MKKHYRLAVEQLESRLLLDAGAGHEEPTHMASDLAYLEGLVEISEASHVAVRNGNWSQASTWQGGRLPTADARVFIPRGISVVYNIGQSPRLDWIRDEGRLSFAATGAQSLLVETIAVMPTGRFNIGTAVTPAANRVTVTFADNGELCCDSMDETCHDPLQLGRGLISHGQVGIYGKPTTSFLPTTVNPIAGSNRIQVAGAAQWAVGSTLLVTGTLVIGEDEEVIIRSRATARGVTTYTVDRPLTYNHTAPAGLHAYVAVENRTITFTSENTTDSSRFGHVMLMHSMNVAVKYAAFTHLGRTDKSIALDDVTNPDGTSGGGTNVRGRYGLHFHRTGTNPMQAPIQVVGNFLTDSPGWGYVNHSSNVAFRDNVSFNVTGAGFAAETGGEIGSFTHNLAVFERGGFTNTKRGEQDYGAQGVGFHFQGGNTDVVNNIATGAAGGGFSYTGSGFDELGSAAMVPAASLRDPSIAHGAATLRATLAPLRTFVGNEVFNSDTGWQAYTLRPTVTTRGTNTIDRFLAWNVLNGILGAYCYNLTITNARLFDSVGVKTAIEASGDSKHWTISNAYVQGWGYGYRLPTVGDNKVIGGFWDNKIDFFVGESEDTARSIAITAVTFGVNPILVKNGQTYTAKTNLDYRVSSLRAQGRVTLNGRSVYALEQAANYIPFLRAGNYPDEYIGLTNQELMDSFGVAIGNEVAPADAVSVAAVRGLVKP